jgi:hypothetical protein
LSALTAYEASERRKGSVLFVERRDGKVVPIDTRSEHGSQIQHTYAYTEYREQGSKRYAELHMASEKALELLRQSAFKTSSRIHHLPRSNFATEPNSATGTGRRTF